MDLNTCSKSEKTGNIFTPKGILFYSQYLINKSKNDKGDEYYSGQICFPPSADLTLLKNEMGKIALENLDGDTNRAKKFVENRFIDPNNKPKGGKRAGDRFEGWTLISAASGDKPDFVHPSGKPIADESLKGEVYSGRWARFSINPYWSKTNKVLGLGLSNVQVLDHDDPIGFVKTAGTEEFDAVEGVDDGAASDTGGDDINSLFG